MGIVEMDFSATSSILIRRLPSAADGRSTERSASAWRSANL
jgi:hypothetical protein